MEGLKVLIEKLSQYNILTNILPGTILCIVFTFCIGYNMLVTDNWYLQCVIFYFAGIVNNRFGSLALEPLLKKLKILKFTSYKDYIVAESKDAKITILSTENNVFRSYASLCVIAIFASIFKILEDKIEWIKNCESEYKMMTLLVLLLIVFILSYRKQTSYVNKRINDALEIDKEDKANNAKEI